MYQGEDLTRQMKDKIKSVLNKLTYDKFERLELIRNSTIRNIVVKADISTDGVISYYELWNEFEEKLMLLAIAPCAREISEEQLELLNPGFDKYMVCQPNDENKWNLLEWLTTQTEYQIPPALRGIREEAMSLSDLLDWEFEDIREKFLDE